MAKRTPAQGKTRETVVRKATGLAYPREERGGLVSARAAFLFRRVASRGREGLTKVDANRPCGSAVRSLATVLFAVVVVASGLEPAEAAARAPVISASPTSKDFGQVEVGQASAAASLVIANKGRAPLRIAGITVSGAAKSDFALLTSTCQTAALAPRARCTFKVAFVPTDAGVRAARIAVSFKDPKRPKALLSVRGTGVVPTPPPEPEPAPVPAPEPPPPAVTLDPACDAFVDGMAASTGDGTAARPWQTIQEAADRAAAGQTVCIRGGSYGEQVVVNRSGSEGQPIVFTSYPGETAVIDATRVTSRTGVGRGVVVVDQRSWITLAGLSIVDNLDTTADQRSGILVRNSAHVVIDRIAVRDAAWAGIYVFGADDVTVSASSTYNTRSSGIYVDTATRVTVDGNDVQRAVNGGTEECISIVSVDGFEVRDNSVHNGLGISYGGEGICVKMGSSHGKVYRNRVYDLPAGFDPAVHEDGEVGIYVCPYSAGNPDPAYNPQGIGPLHDVEVFANTVSTPEGISVAAEQGGIAENVRVYDNVIHSGAYDGIQISECCNGNEGLKRNVEIVNNTIYGQGGVYGGGVTVRGRRNEGLAILNNIVVGNASWQIRDKSGTAYVSNNLIDGYRGYSQEVLGDSCIQADPGFRDPLAGDFRLWSSSPAIDMGHEIPGLFQPAFDHDLVPRSDGRADLGAFEY